MVCIIYKSVYFVFLLMNDMLCQMFDSICVANIEISEMMGNHRIRRAGYPIDTFHGVYRSLSIPIASIGPAHKCPIVALTQKICSVVWVRLTINWENQSIS